MKINTLFFGITKDLTNTTQLYIDVEENTTVKDFKAILIKQFPALQNINSYAIAVNETYATDDDLLANNDDVAVIPPVSGG